MPGQRWGRVLGGVLFLAIVPSCANGIIKTTPKIARTATRGVVEELVELTNDDTLDALAPDVHAASERAAAGLLEGTLDTLDDDARRAQIHRAATLFGDEVEALVRRTGNALGEEAEEHVVALTDRVLDRAEALEIDLPRTAAAITRSTLRTLALELENGLDDHASPAIERLLADHVGPGLADALGHDVGPAVAGTLRDDLGPALGKVVREDLGPALVETTDAIAAKIESRLGAAVDTGKQTVDRLLLAGLLLAIVVIGAFVVLWILARQREREEWKRAEARERALALVTEAIYNADQNDAGAMGVYRDAVKRLGGEATRRDAFAELKRFVTLRPNLELPSRKAPR